MQEDTCNKIAHERHLLCTYLQKESVEDSNQDFTQHETYNFATQKIETGNSNFN